MIPNLKNIVLVGAGQLGSRHLQGLAGVEVPSRVFVVDPGESSLEVARQRFGEMPAGMVREISYLTSLDAIPPVVDLAVVATGADVRADVTHALLERCQLSHLILEKVLFQKEADYRRIGDLVDRHGLTAAVNCPRRLFPYYLELKDALAGEGPVRFVVEGSQWGLGCNAVHYLDLFAFLTGDGALRIESADLVQLESKRAGYLEFAGRICGKNGRQDSFEIASAAEPGVVPRVLVETRTGRIEVYETAGRAVKTLSHGSVTEEPYRVLYQSQLTGKVASRLLKGESSGLTPYRESAALHLPLLRVFLDHLASTGNRCDLCPIT